MGEMKKRLITGNDFDRYIFIYLEIKMKSLAYINEHVAQQSDILKYTHTRCSICKKLCAGLTGLLLTKAKLMINVNLF
jgi:hypothetical protein